MFEPVKIAPSILSADFMHLGRDIELIEKAGAGYVHVDVMDGHFVPNLTMGVPVVKQLKKATGWRAPSRPFMRRGRRRPSASSPARRSARWRRCLPIWTWCWS